MFKEILKFSLFVAMVAAKGSDQNEHGSLMMIGKGYCMAHTDVIYWCTAGTPMGDKLGKAIAFCDKKIQDCGKKGCKVKGLFTTLYYNLAVSSLIVLQAPGNVPVMWDNLWKIIS